MANTNPTTKRVPGKRSWQTIAMTRTDSQVANQGEGYHDWFIKRIIHGVFIKYNILTSNILITKYATGQRGITLKYIKMPGARRREEGSQESSQIENIIKVIEAILGIKYGARYKMRVIKAGNIFADVKLVADYVTKQIKRSPRQHRQIVVKLWQSHGTAKA